MRVERRSFTEPVHISFAQAGHLAVLTTPSKPDVHVRPCVGNDWWEADIRLGAGYNVFSTKKPDQHWRERTCFRIEA